MPVLDAEMRRWSAMAPEQLISALSDEQTYEVEFDSKKYQVEVQLLDAKVSHNGRICPL
jgi:hypothetical protein